jgi:hypothetical protein
MNDWLVPLLQIGGTGAMIVVAFLIMSKWLWAKINAALDSYVAAYAQETAKIDVRIEHLEKLVEEQARLTKTVESIKDEIAAEAKSRDNRWAFRKDVYVRLVTATSDLYRLYAVEAKCQTMINARVPAYERLVDHQTKIIEQIHLAIREFNTSSDLAPLAMAEDVTSLVLEAVIGIQESHRPLDSPDVEEHIHQKVAVLKRLLDKLHVAGRKDLWGTPEAEEKAGGAK